MRFTHLFKSTVGKKIIMGVSGVALVGFVIAHMAGNLQLFMGRTTLNEYGVGLREHPVLLWGMRLGLIAMALLHVWAAYTLTLQNRASHGFRGETKPVRSSLASRTMAVSGTIVLGFLIYHLLHFTFGVTDPQSFETTDAVGHHDIFYMVVQAFQNPILVGFYLLGVGLLCFHLSHGIAAMFRSLGLASPSYVKLEEKLGWAIAALLFLGFCAVPVSIITGLINLQTFAQ